MLVADDWPAHAVRARVYPVINTLRYAEVARYTRRAVMWYSITACGTKTPEHR
jgi:hypothetical protein